jgi:hypothetical protein
LISGSDEASPQIGNYVRDESPDRFGIKKYVEVCLSCVASDRFQKNLTASVAIPQQTKPKIGTLSRPPDCSPSAPDQREIEENDCVGSAKPDLDSVIGPQVAIHDPCVLLDKPMLYLDPLIAGCRDKARLPEHLVQLYHRQPRDLAQVHRESRFT